MKAPSLRLYSNSNSKGTINPVVVLLCRGPIWIDLLNKDDQFLVLIRLFLFVSYTQQYEDI